MPLTADQRSLVRVLAAILAERGFALAGAGALMEHGFVHRDTADIDLFTNVDQDIGETAELLAKQLAIQNFDVRLDKASSHFARIAVDDLDVDLALNWRGDPVGDADLGPILSVRDAIAGKIEALFTRMENRDVVDVSQLLDFYSMEQMADWAQERDDGFSLNITSEMVTLNGHRPDAGFDKEVFETARAKVLAAIAAATSDENRGTTG